MKIKHCIALAALTLPLVANAQVGAATTAVSYLPTSAYSTQLLQTRATASEVYPTNYDKTETITNDKRFTKAISLKSGDGEQSIAVSQQTDKLIYQDRLTSSFNAKAGEEVSAAIDFSGVWMNAYVYLDCNNDGSFNTQLNANGTPAEGSDVMSYSNYKSKNSLGESSGNGNTRTLPNFTIPANLKPGFYRLRYKIDWDDIDAGGNTTEANNIKQNGGVIVDTRLNVHTDQVNLSCVATASKGTVTLADGTAIQNNQINFGKGVSLKFAAVEGYKLKSVTIRHGYNLDGEATVNGTPQYIDEVIPAYLLTDEAYTVPDAYVDGDVRITPEFVLDEQNENPYALNFSKDLTITRTDRALNTVSFNTTGCATRQTVYVNDPTFVYQDFSNRSIYVKTGDVITTNINYKSANGKPYMHAYLYVDLDGDGVFDTTVNADGTPAANGEMLSYTYANGKNSKGQSLTYNEASADQWGSTNSIPQFSLPKGLPNGKYRARVKIDWDNTDPAGRYGDKYDGNFINDNGGYVVDFNFNVVTDYPIYKLDVQTTNGSIVGANNTGLPETVVLNSPLDVMAFGAADNYNANEIIVRHGHNLDGEQTVNGEQQWAETAIELNNGACTIPSELVDGDVRLTAVFEDDGSDYKLAFSDEFNTADGTQPNSEYWSRSSWESPTWKRYTAQTTAGQLKTGWIEDGKLVLRCVKNDFDDEVNGSGQKLEMISGAIESSDKVTFTYGKVEGRLKTTAHTGNFPAFWMMPNKPTYGGWPSSGEIDIFEQIDNEDKSYHTIHTHWANGSADGGLGQSNNPKKGGTSNNTTGEYHVYGLEWTENIIKWYVDGKQTFSYAKSTNQDDLDKLQWPFDKPFYLILNQSVGNGSWASNRDLNFTYETKFDWVRVYQKADGDYITSVTGTQQASTLDYYVAPGSVRLVTPYETFVRIVDMQGRNVFAQNVQGNKNVQLPSGVYLINGNKVLVP